MIGWVISRTLPQKEWHHAQDIAEISKSAPIPTYIPVRLFYRSVSRYAPGRKPVRELLAPRLVFVQAGYRNIKRVQALRSCEGIVLDSDMTPYVIDPESMGRFMDAVGEGNAFIEQLEQEALGLINEAKKPTWLKLGEDIRTRLLAIVGITRG